MLADNPRLGPARPDIAEGPRLFPIQCCVILFREPADGIEIVRIVQNIAPNFGGINLEDISAPRCFEIERRLQARLDIPVFHDDQHGTAVVAAAALRNAAPIIPNPDARLSGGMTSAMYAPAVEKLAAVMPDTTRPTKSSPSEGASAIST